MDWALRASAWKRQVAVKKLDNLLAKMEMVVANFFSDGIVFVGAEVFDRGVASLGRADRRPLVEDWVAGCSASCFSFVQMLLRKCSWLRNPPLVCAHGGESSKAFPNTMAAYHIALDSQVDCIEIDVSRSSDGVLFALHDSYQKLSNMIIRVEAVRNFDSHNMGRDLQRITGNSSSRVGYFSTKEIKDLHRRSELNDINVPTVEDALKLVSSSVRQVVLDAKVGPPSYERGLAKDILSTIERTQCKNCLVWAKSDSLVRDVIKLSSNVTVGYIVMNDPSTGARTNLLRMRAAGVVGAYHRLIDDKLVKILHGRNRKVFAWTVDDEVSMRKMLYERVDAIVTGNSTLLQRLMQDVGTQCLEEGFSLSA
ncbi:hypothetical protein RJ640_013460 [Escallonia rubra]|uniref:glycerophosphodiester phosphodiesterase n=1 Tax=Escallonia rubra TaxID=112253 RepID=A0AA88QEF8_9ASTE|nr:hypothetical protein RJ640_013460 [Escallonia rubra]